MKFSFELGGGGGVSRPPLSAFSGSAPGLDQANSLDRSTESIFMSCKFMKAQAISKNRRFH